MLVANFTYLIKKKNYTVDQVGRNAMMQEAWEACRVGKKMYENRGAKDCSFVPSE